MRREAHGFSQQGIKSCTLQSDNAQFRQYLLLADALFKGAERQIRRLLVRLLFHHRFVIVLNSHTRRRLPFNLTEDVRCIACGVSPLLGA